MNNKRHDNLMALDLTQVERILQREIEEDERESVESISTLSKEDLRDLKILTSNGVAFTVYLKYKLKAFDLKQVVYFRETLIN